MSIIIIKKKNVHHNYNCTWLYMIIYVGLYHYKYYSCEKNVLHSQTLGFDVHWKIKTSKKFQFF